MAEAAPPEAVTPEAVKPVYLLWDKPECLWEKATVSRNSPTVLGTFLFKLSKLESTFGDSVVKLAKEFTALPFVEGPTMTTAWKSLLSQTEDLGKEFSSISKAVVSSTSYSDLQKNTSALDEPSRQFKEAIDSAKKSVAEQKDPAKKKAAEEALGKTTMASLGKFQDLDFERMRTMREVILKAVSSVSNSLQSVYRTALQETRMIRAVSPNDDMLAFCQSKASGVACPYAAPAEDPKSPRPPETPRSPSEVKNRPPPPPPEPDLPKQARKGKGIKVGGDFKTGYQTISYQTMRKGNPRSIDDKSNPYKTIKMSANKEPPKLPAGEDAEVDEAFSAAMKFATLKKEKYEKEKKEKAAKEKEERERAEKEKAEKEKAEKDKAAKEAKETKEAADKALEKAAEEEAEAAFSAAMVFAAKKAAERRAQQDEEKKREEEKKRQEQAEIDKTKGESVLSTAALDEVEYGMRVPIVIDNGSAYFKAGFAGDHDPCLVIPSTIANYTKSEYKGGKPSAHMVGSSALHIGPQLCTKPNVVTINDGFSDNPSWDDVELVWEYLLNRLSDDPADHPILMTQPCLAPLKLKKTMQEILYEKFGVRELFVAEGPLMSTYAYGQSSGLVVEVGHSSAQIVPVIDGYVLTGRVQRVKHFGGFADTKRIVDYFTQHTTPDILEKSKYSTTGHLLLMAQMIKDRLCFCPSSKSAFDDELAVMEDVKGFLGGHSPGDGVVLPKKPHCVTLHQALLTCGEMLFSPNELLQDEDASVVSLQALCAKVVNSCDLDTRNALLSNVCLSGQVTTMPGFDERLLNELKDTVKHAPQINVFGESRRYAPWAGASVLACLEDFASEWQTKEDWEDGHA